jgi:23S rRNA pseudouridine2605 synthase
MRLGKYLANAGVASRRASEEIIFAGRVRVENEVVTDPARDVDATMDITVDHDPVILTDSRLVYVLNKPRGVVSTAQDTHDRPTVVDFVPSNQRLYPVGRLDADTTGLILLTNDGDLAHRLTHPSFEVDKTYLVVVSGGAVRERALASLREGIELEDGMTAPARVERVRSDTLALTIHEGRNRQVRRMCEAVGHPVVSLQRVRFGTLSLGHLKLGAYRRLSPPEINQLAAGAPEPTSRPRSSARRTTPAKPRAAGTKPRPRGNAPRGRQ